GDLPTHVELPDPVRVVVLAGLVLRLLPLPGRWVVRRDHPQGRQDRHPAQHPDHTPSPPRTLPDRFPSWYPRRHGRTPPRANAAPRRGGTGRGRAGREARPEPRRPQSRRGPARRPGAGPRVRLTPFAYRVSCPRFPPREEVPVRLLSNILKALRPAAKPAPPPK